MALLIDLWKGKSLNDVWKALKEMRFSKKTAEEWHVIRLNNNELKEQEEVFNKLPDTIIVHGDGKDLVKLQDELEVRGAHCKLKVKPENYHYNYVFIHHFVEKTDEDVSQEIAAVEISTSNSNDKPQP